MFTEYLKVSGKITFVLTKHNLRSFLKNLKIKMYVMGVKLGLSH